RQLAQDPIPVPGPSLLQIDLRLGEAERENRARHDVAQILAQNALNPRAERCHPTKSSISSSGSPAPTFAPPPGPDRPTSASSSMASSRLSADLTPLMSRPIS